jgi:pantoate--beta-alanine ligase
MQIVSTIAGLRRILSEWRAQQLRIGFVPTMGNLHDGHLRLMSVAKGDADRVIASIFVNPTQFGVGEDFSAYPRTEQDDQQKLMAIGVDLLFMPEVIEMYLANRHTIISVNALANIHCGLSRPGHFDGVATVVNKFFNIVQPDVAFFGQKDYQQLLVIETMVRDLNIPVDIKSVPIVREIDGLAMSSRNGYLSVEERKCAPMLYQALSRAKDEIMWGNQNFEIIENDAKELLKNNGFLPDYFTICNGENLQPAQIGQHDLVILAAAKLGRTRLIDNIHFISKKQ